MSQENYQYEVEGEVIKMIHDELPAVRWTCAACNEDSCTIFFEPEENEKIVTCEFCEASHLVKKS
jgi:transcription elongation factor Elf1